MSTQHTGNVEPSLDLEEHRSVGGVNAKAVVPYLYSGNSLVPTASPLIDLAYDYVGFTNADGNGNYQTVSYKTGGSAGTTVRTLSMTFDASSNVTSITRT